MNIFFDLGEFKKAENVPDMLRFAPFKHNFLKFLEGGSPLHLFRLGHFTLRLIDPSAFRNTGLS